MQYVHISMSFMKTVFDPMCVPRMPPPPPTNTSTPTPAGLRGGGDAPAQHPPKSIYISRTMNDIHSSIQDLHDREMSRPSIPGNIILH